MKCIKCNNEIEDGSKYCSNCGKSIELNDSGSFWYLILGLFFPLIATILYCIYSGSKPNTSKKLMIGFIIGYVIAMVRTIVLFFFIIIGGISSIDNISDCAKKCDGSFSYTNGKCVCREKNYKYSNYDDIYDYDDFNKNFFFD